MGLMIFFQKKNKITFFYLRMGSFYRVYGKRKLGELQGSLEFSASTRGWSPLLPPHCPCHWSRAVGNVEAIHIKYFFN
jgi:hypothetical protein